MAVPWQSHKVTEDKNVAKFQMLLRKLRSREEGPALSEGQLGRGACGGPVFFLAAVPSLGPTQPLLLVDFCHTNRASVLGDCVCGVPDQDPRTTRWPPWPHLIRW
jgi:hypothetical protein